MPITKSRQGAHLPLAVLHAVEGGDKQTRVLGNEALREERKAPGALARPQPSVHHLLVAALHHHGHAAAEDDEDKGAALALWPGKGRVGEHRAAALVSQDHQSDCDHSGIMASLPTKAPPSPPRLPDQRVASVRRHDLHLALRNMLQQRRLHQPLERGRPDFRRHRRGGPLWHAHPRVVQEIRGCAGWMMKPGRRRCECTAAGSVTTGITSERRHDAVQLVSLL